MRFTVVLNVFFVALFTGMVAAKAVPAAHEVAIRADPAIQACATTNATTCGVDSQCFPATASVIPDLGVST